MIRHTKAVKSMTIYESDLYLRLLKKTNPL